MPNKRLYPLLFSVSLLITIVALLIPADSKWFSLLSSIGCGAVASVLIAWLVELSNWRADRIRKTEIRKSYLNSFFNEFESGILGFVQICCKAMAVPGDEPHMTWHEWCVHAFNCIGDNKAYCVLFVESCVYFLEGLDAQLKQIENQKSALLASGIINPEDIRAASDIMGFNNYLRLSGQLPSEKKCARQTAEAMKFFVDLVFDNLERADVLKEANRRQVGNLYYKAFMMNGCFGATEKKSGENIAQ